MTFQICIAGGEIEFPCEPSEFVLDAAERAGFTLPYSCRKGVCNTCEGRLVDGEAEQQGKGFIRGPYDAVLFCRAKPRSDLKIKPKRIEKTEPPRRKTLTATVIRSSRPAVDVTILQLRFPIGIRAKFKAGQYLQVILPDGDRRNFSMANPPYQNEGVQLHVRHVPGGRFSEGILSQLAPGKKLQVELPYGDVFLRPTVNLSAILLATGTGFAPIKSTIEDAIKTGSERPMRLYWGGRRVEDLYLCDLPEKWANDLAWFSFVPVLSESSDAWSGRTGLLHRAVLNDYQDLSTTDVYACGNPMMIAAAQEAFVNSRRLPVDRFYSDSFVESGTSSAQIAGAG
jgi:NAD(P)H-flavin reductase/ferredoxin